MSLFLRRYSWNGYSRTGWEICHIFGNQKFNIHTKPAEFLPAAEKPTYGSLDICLVVEEPIDVVKCDIEEKGYPIELGPVARHGARGDMKSIYLRDPDGNLVELCHYNL